MRRLALALVAAAALVGCGGDDGSAEDLCAAVRSDHTLATVFTGFDPTDADRALDQLRTARVTLGELRDAAPSEVRDDIDVEIEYVQALIEGLEDVDAGDPAEAVEVVRRVTADHPDVADAAAELAAFSDERCS